MPIFKRKDPHMQRVAFGFGDIGVHCAENSVAFSQLHDLHPIGDSAESVTYDEPCCILTFYDAKSVDMVIDRLKHVKGYLLANPSDTAFHNNKNADLDCALALARLRKSE